MDAAGATGAAGSAGAAQTAAGVAQTGAAQTATGAAQTGAAQSNAESHPGDAARTRRAHPLPAPEAEHPDRPVGRSSAFAVSPAEGAGRPARHDSASAGFRPAAEAAGSRPAAEGAARPARHDAASAGSRLAAEAAGSRPAVEGAGGPAVAAQTGGFDALFADLAPAPAPAPAASQTTDAPASRRRDRTARGFPERPEISTDTVPVAAVPAPAAAADPTDASAGISSLVEGRAAEASVTAMPVTEASPSLSAWADAAAAPVISRRAAASARRDGAPGRRDVARDAPASSRRSAPHGSRAIADRRMQAATSADRRRGRGAGRLASVVAMSFAAMLAVATTIPSLSLLTPSDVQALALAETSGTDLDGQRVQLNGDIVAQTMQRDGYETQTIDEYARAAGIRPEATFTNNPAGTIQWPFAVGVHIGDRFGYRSCAGCSSNHGGQDFNPGLGAEIQAIADGTVAVSTDSGGSLGVVMMIDHIIDGELVTSVYAHMEYESRRFEVGDTVAVGDVIGTTGDTGMSTGPHLHFEIRLGGVDGTKVDPLEWLYANTN